MIQKGVVLILLIVVCSKCEEHEMGSKEEVDLNEKVFAKSVIDEEANTEALDSKQVNVTFVDQTDANTTSPLNDTKSTHRWNCKSFAVNENSSAAVVILNNETEIFSLFDRMNSSQGCGLVLFYSPHCEFCVELAPLINAVGRSFPNISVIAVDAQEAMGMAARYGVSAIPAIFFFYAGKPVAKFNRTRTVESFSAFIKELSSFEPTTTFFNVTGDDLSGPLGTTLKNSRDYYMIFSVSFLLVYFMNRVFGQLIWSITCMAAEYLKTKFQRQKVD